MLPLRFLGLIVVMLLVAGCETLPSGETPLDLLAHEVRVPQQYRAGDGWPGMDGPAKRYTSAYESGWWACVERFARDINHDPSRVVRTGNGWPAEVDGYRAGHDDAAVRVRAVIAKFGKEKAREIFSASLVPPGVELPKRQLETRLTYHPTEVNLTGVIERRVFAGPPNYQNFKAGDARETCWILRLREPVTVAADSETELKPTETGVDEIQLVLETEELVRYERLLGHPVTVFGLLFHAHTGHHHTPVLMKVRVIESVTGKSFF